MSDSLSYDPGMKVGLSHVGQVVYELEGIKGRFQARMAGAGPLMDNAGSKLDESIYKTTNALTDISMGVIDGGAMAFKNIKDRGEYSAKALETSDSFAGDAAQAWTGGGHRG